MADSLTYDHIESVVGSLPVQNRIMLRLLLLQYLDPTQEDIDYMAEDRPDSRFNFGAQPVQQASVGEAKDDIAARISQYVTMFRQKRERPWMQVQCLKRQIAQTQQAVSAAEDLLSKTLGVDSSILEDRRRQANAALPKPEIRRLERSWQTEEITEEEFKKARLLIEYQTLLRRLDRQRRRLATAERDFQFSSSAALQDHEIAHIWGIPLGSLAGRKVKALSQYLNELQKKLKEIESTPLESSPARPPDLWRETFTVLSRKPPARSVVAYDGLERTEEALMEKLRHFASGIMPEDRESGFWATINRITDTEHGGQWHSHARAIFALQRLSAIQEELDLSPEMLEQELLARVTPRTKDDALPSPEPKEEPVELSEQGLGVLQAFAGEPDDKRMK